MVGTLEEPERKPLAIGMSCQTIGTVDSKASQLGVPKKSAHVDAHGVRSYLPHYPEEMRPSVVE